MHFQFFTRKPFKNPNELHFLLSAIGVVAGVVSSGPAIAEHSILTAGLDPKQDPIAHPLDEGQQAALLQGVQSVEQWLEQIESSPPPGHIFYKALGEAHAHAHCLYSIYVCLLLCSEEALPICLYLPGFTSLIPPISSSIQEHNLPSNGRVGNLGGGVEHSLAQRCQLKSCRLYSFTGLYNIRRCLIA